MYTTCFTIGIQQCRVGQCFFAGSVFFCFHLSCVYYIALSEQEKKQFIILRVHFSCDKNSV